MSDTDLDLIRDAHGAITALLARVTVFLDTVDADIAERVAQYDALASDLETVVNGAMEFTATVDPDDAAPSMVRDGTFATIKSAIDAAPAGSTVTLKLLAGKTYAIDTNIDLRGRAVELVKSGSGDDPVLAPLVYATGSSNRPYQFNGKITASLRLSRVAVQFPAKADDALPWSWAALVQMTYGTACTVHANNSTITGSNEQALASTFVGSLVQMALNDVTFDGANGCTVTNGTAVIARSSTTLINGAQVHVGGTVGANVLIT